MAIFLLSMMFPALNPPTRSLRSARGAHMRCRSSAHHRGELVRWRRTRNSAFRVGFKNGGESLENLSLPIEKYRIWKFHPQTLRRRLPPLAIETVPLSVTFERVGARVDVPSGAVSTSIDDGALLAAIRCTARGFTLQVRGCCWFLRLLCQRLPSLDRCPDDWWCLR